MSPSLSNNSLVSDPFVDPFNLIIFLYLRANKWLAILISKYHVREMR